MSRFFLITFLTFCVLVQAQDNVQLDYYLPQDVTYNKDIPKPQDVLGYVPGEWHVSHDKLVNYMQVLQHQIYLAS